MADIQRRFPATKVSNWTSGAFGTPAALPGAPSEVVGTAGNTQVTLTWTAGAENNGTISGYKVEKNSGSWSDVTADTGSASTSYTVTSLTNGTAYTFRVSAINEVGTGDASSASSAVTPLTVPGAPGSLSAAAVSDSSVASLSWSAPGTPGGSAIVGYSIKRDSTEIVYDTGDTTTSYKDGESAFSSPYTYYVAAVNAAGQSAYSPGASVTTDAPGAPPPFSASGGTTGSHGSYSVHRFTSSGTFTVTAGQKDVDLMIISGGGGGAGGDQYGYQWGGGGGGGGLLVIPLSVSSTGGPAGNGVYPVTIGAGGTAGAGGSYTPAPTRAGGIGGSSGFSGVNFIIGGGGGAGNCTPRTPAAGYMLGWDGACGGGGTWYIPHHGYYGYDGPAAYGLPSGGGGGGGGMGGAGRGGPPTSGAVDPAGSFGTGGAGLANSHSTGSPILYCGGGAGSCEGPLLPNIHYNIGGPGGGGRSGDCGPGSPGPTTPRPVTAGTAGSTNLGGGGGGGGPGAPTAAAQPGGAGGSGFVVVRYPT